MARRIRLKKDGSAMEKAFEVQELLSVPETGKLHKISNEMSAAYDRDDLPLDEKIRLYQRKLAYLQQLSDKIVKNGGTSLANGPQQVRLLWLILEFLNL